MASRVAEVGSLFLWVWASICESCRQKVRRTIARARFACQIVKKIGLRALLEGEAGNVHQTVARARFQVKIVES